MVCLMFHNNSPSTFLRHHFPDIMPKLDHKEPTTIHLCLPSITPTLLHLRTLPITQLETRVTCINVLINAAFQESKVNLN